MSGQSVMEIPDLCSQECEYVDCTSHSSYILLKSSHKIKSVSVWGSRVGSKHLLFDWKASCSITLTLENWKIVSDPSLTRFAATTICAQPRASTEQQPNRIIFQWLETLNQVNKGEVPEYRTQQHSTACLPSLPPTIAGQLLVPAIFLKEENAPLNLLYNI